MADNKEKIDISNLSDEDFLKLSPEQLEALETPDEDEDKDKDKDVKTPEEIEDERWDNLSAEEQHAENAAVEEEDRRAALTQEERDAEDGKGADDEDKDGDKDSEAGDSSSADDANNDAGDSTGDDGDSGDKDKDTKDKPDATVEVDYAEIGKQIMGEIKANGTTLKIKTAEDAIKLIQMGANYHQKMKGLKPSMKTLKLLENHGLLDPVKLNYLIDLHEKKPEAITQLLKDSGMDPMDIDLKGEETYKPATRTVNDKDLVLDDVLASIKGTEHYNQTLTVIADEWDDESRATILADPAIIRTINGHMQNGIYDQVANAVTYQRTLGNLQGVSDLEAYQQAGAHMMENNLFTSNGKASSDNQGDQGSKRPGETKETAAQKEARLKKKKGASPSRRKAASKKEKEDFNPLGMSDEDFAKHTNMSL